MQHNIGAILKNYLLIISLLLGFSALAQRPYIEFKENKGQWHQNIIYKAKLPAGELFLEQNGLTYQFIKEDDLLRIDELHHSFIKNPTKVDSIINLHAFKVNFKNSLNATLQPAVARPDYENYFLGNDNSKWASNVKKYEELTYHQIYNNIDLTFYLKDGIFKYDFIVQPNGNPQDIQLTYDGVDEIFIKNGNLHIKTSVNEIVEQNPYAYQNINGKEKEVKCLFQLKNNTLSFHFPKGYDINYPLIIDPALIFASYSGSTVDNWGYTSTFNDAGNLFAGGVSFGVGYPVTTGAIQTTFGGGAMDISISKFSPNGSSLEYSTYFGGGNSDYPHSMIVNSNDELLVFGVTNSNNFPTTPGAYSTTLSGAYDTYVAKFSANGQTLLASTYIGGSGNDGLNNVQPLQYNYADQHRGEIIVDTNDNIFVATVTSSTDFPVTAGTIQASSAGGNDGCVFKLSPNLNTLLFSTYIGGTGTDAAYSLQFASNGDILITGGTTSSDFPTTPGTLHPTSLGNTDGWLMKINNTATSILASTYIGTANNYNQCYFVQLDIADNVFVIGQTVGGYPIFPATVYNNPNSGQFIHKLTNDLSTTVFSTTFGRGSGFIDIALSAFLVNECNYILLSGWGGTVNSSFSLATNSTTNNLPITPNAIQPTTNGSDYYLAMFSEDADSLMYATFFGGNISSDHVDGGTSRFDKKGIVYQAVCAGCWANSDFPTTPSAWSNTNNSTGCNLGVFKLDLSNLTADAEVFTTPYYCIGDTVHFQNLSNGGVNYFWDFDDGNTSTNFQPTHIFDSTGTYHVMLVALDSISCIIVDTDYVDVFIGAPPTAITNPINGICRGDSIQLNASGGASYVWTPNYNISNDSIDNPFVFPDTTTLYTVVVHDSCGTDTAEILVTVFQKNIGISPDITICWDMNTQISATGGIDYLWFPAATLDNANIANPIATPGITTTYNVTITDINGCIWDTSMTVITDSVSPIANAWNDTIICLGDSGQIFASGGSSYFWTPTNTIINPNSSSPIVFPSQNTQYTVEVANACGVDYDSVIVQVRFAVADAWPDTAVCPNQEVQLFSSGGNVISWNPENAVYQIENDYFTRPTISTEYMVTIEDSAGCQGQASLNISLLPPPFLDAGEDQWLFEDSLLINAAGVGNFAWSPSIFVSCDTCQNTSVFPNETTTFTVMLTDSLGCINSDQVTIFVTSEIWVPNAFTPNGDGTNDVFFVKTFRIKELELYIFDRWGEQLFYSDDLNIGWDGLYKGTLVKNDVYVWKVTYKDVLGRRGELIGTVTLIR